MSRNVCCKDCASGTFGTRMSSSFVDQSLSRPFLLPSLCITLGDYVCWCAGCGN